MMLHASASPLRIVKGRQTFRSSCHTMLRMRSRAGPVSLQDDGFSIGTSKIMAYFQSESENQKSLSSKVLVLVPSACTYKFCVKCF